MSDSIFNPEAFLSTAYEESPPDHYTPIDEGEYLVTLKAPKVRKNSSADGREFYVADFDCIIEDDAVKAKLNMEQPTARFSVFLDVTRDGALDMGTNKNVKLGQLKKACGLRDGKRWTLMHFDGATCWGRLKNEADKNDPERIYNRIVSVTQEPTTKKDDRKAA